MDFNQFFCTDSANDKELSFVLELMALMQLESSNPIHLRIHTDRDLSFLINKFLWKSHPEITTEGPKDSEVYLEIFSNKLKFQAGHYLLASDSNERPGNSIYVPSHLLKSEIESPDIATAKAFSIAHLILNNKFSSDAPSKKITLFYSDELREWLSLVEATEGLISFWYRQRDEKTELELINLNQITNSAELKKVAFASDRIVILKITPKTSHIIKTLRTLNPQCSLTFHGFESASVFFANTFLLEIQDYLCEEDHWIFSCETDAKLARLAWERINFSIKPLKFPTPHKNKRTSSTGRNLLFFGRITEQKNLHEGLFAVKLIAERMRSEGRKFKIFGYEDFLGVPNLRIPSLGYLEYLFKLAKTLKIEDLIEFHPAVAVDKMEEELSQGLFFSPSVHSDENFGLVAFRSLNIGVPAILSHWGGHQDFSKYFSSVNYFPVYKTGKGPKCNPVEMASVINECWNQNVSPAPLRLPDVTLPETVSGTCPLKATNLKLQIENRIRDSFPWKIRKWPLYGKLFRNYEDQKYQLTLEAYGARARGKFNLKKCYLSPEVEILDSELKVLDCRAGVLRYSRSEEIKDRRVKKLDNSEVLLSQAEWSWLWNNGYIYSGESYEL